MNWLDYREAKSRGENEALDYLTSLDGVIPEQPEQYVTLKRLRRSETQVFSGGLYNQPHLFMMEMSAVENGEALHNQRILANQRLRNAK